jgi:hypothetical protein
VSTVLMTDCAGLWRRTLLIGADGSPDAGTGVLWLQGLTAYVDSRGFAGRLDQCADVFEWNRLIDVEAPGEFPDAGRMHWDAGTLVEVGVHSDYVEHWVRDDASVRPCWAVIADGAILLRVGDVFGWAEHRGVVVGTVGAHEWLNLSPRMCGSELEANGVRWQIVDSEGDVDL